MQALLSLRGDVVGRPGFSTVVVLGFAEAGFAGGGGPSLGERRAFGGLGGIGVVIFGGGWVLNEKFLEERGKRRGRRRRVLRWLLVLEERFWGRRSR